MRRRLGVVVALTAALCLGASAATSDSSGGKPGFVTFELASTPPQLLLTTAALLSLTMRV